MSSEEFHAYLVKLHNLTPEEAAKWDSEYITTASRFNFPRETWGNPGIAECIQLFVRADKLQQDLSIAAVRREGKYWVSPTENAVHSDIATTKRSKDAEEPGFQPAHMETIISAYHITEVLMRCVSVILEDSISGDLSQRDDYILNKANVALEALGFHVSEKE